MEYNVELEEFQGPMDLLLELIKKNDLDILNIDLTLITDQYLHHINEMEKINLNVSAEYLVVAAELISIKGRKLVPNHQDGDDEEQEFINRVIEYKNYRDASEHFACLVEQRNCYFSKEPSDISIYKEEIVFSEKISEQALIDAFVCFLKQKESEGPITAKVVKKEYSIAKRMKEIEDVLNLKKKINFLDLFEDYNKPYIVVTFVTILEMSKKGLLEIVQNINQKDIFLVKKDGAKC